MSSAGRELRFQWPVNSSGCTREQIKTQLKFAILPTECVFHYRLNPKKRSSDSDNNFRCIDFYDQFAKLMTLLLFDIIAFVTSVFDAELTRVYRNSSHNYQLARLK